jgi:hypothetical protein
MVKEELARWSALNQFDKDARSSVRALDAASVDAIAAKTEAVTRALGWTDREVGVAGTNVRNALAFLKRDLGAAINRGNIEEIVAQTLKILEEKEIDPNAFEPIAAIREMAALKDNMAIQAGVLHTWSADKREG